jgi:hypothetical protein
MDSILAFLNNQQFALLAALVVPFLFKYIPAFKGISNQLCALLAALSAWATNAFVPPAHAALLGGALAGFGSIFIPFIDALITKVLHDHVFNPAYKAVGLKTP